MVPPSVIASAARLYQIHVSSGVKFSAGFLSRLLEFCSEQTPHSSSLPSTLHVPTLAEDIFASVQEFHGHTTVGNYAALMRTLAHFEMYTRYVSCARWCHDDEGWALIRTRLGARYSGRSLYCTSVHREKYHIPIHGNLNGNRLVPIQIPMNGNVEQSPVMGAYILNSRPMYIYFMFRTWRKIRWKVTCTIEVCKEFLPALRQLTLTRADSSLLFTCVLFYELSTMAGNETGSKSPVNQLK